MNNQETLSQAAAIQQLRASDVIRNDYVRAQFIAIWNAIWKEGGEAAYEREAMYFNERLRDNERLRKATGMSVFLSFIDLAVRGLTLEPGPQALCYLLPRNCCVGRDQQGKNLYETRCNLTISGYGELVLRAKAGQILHADNPVVVYEGDDFSFGERDGRKYVNYCCRIPRQSSRIVACFLKITRPDGTVDYAVMTEPDWRRLSAFSGKANRSWDEAARRWVDNPNPLYTAGADGQIDAGFLRAKCIKHAFKSYPKIPIGAASQLESDVAGEPEPGAATVAAAPDPEPDFCAAQRDRQLAAGVTVDPAATYGNAATTDDVF